MKCKDCQVYQEHPCWRYPPQLSYIVVPVQGTIQNPNPQLQIQGCAGHPAVQDDHWCGEFQPKQGMLS
jgi:hypothetical protein